MPSGKVHTLTTLGLAVGSIPMADPVVSVGILSGLILSPDLDVDNGFVGLSHLRRVPFVGTANRIRAVVYRALSGGWITHHIRLDGET